MKRQQILAVVATALCLAGCGSAVEWSRKITVVVNTPSGEVSGSSVQHETIVRKGGWWAPPEATGAKRRLAGEAVVVDLGEGKYLFALLQDNKPDTFQVLRPGEAPLEIAEDMATMRGPHMLSTKDYPPLVTFADLNNPKSVKAVRPSEFAAVFGPGYALKSITLEITDEALVQGKIESVLGWIDSYRGRYLDGGTTSSPQNTNISNHIGDSGFRIER